MKLFLVFMGLLVGCLAQFPHPCRMPPYLTGSFEVALPNEQIFLIGKYMYDAVEERMRVVEMGTVQNVSFKYDSLMLFKEAALYMINPKEKTCVKKNLSQAFKPAAVPRDAVLLAQSVLGSTSGPGEGLLVNSWTGDLPDNAGKYIVTVTEYGCIPVSTLLYTEKTGWGVVSYFNNLVGISNPNALNPPSYCQDAEASAASEEPVDFFSVFRNKH